MDNGVGVQEVGSGPGVRCIVVFSHYQPGCTLQLKSGLVNTQQLWLGPAVGAGRVGRGQCTLAMHG